MLELKNIFKKFESPVFSDLNASFEKGKVHLITGRNASGKTTLLKIISGRLAADSGSILLDGKPLPGHGHPFNLFSFSAVEEKFYEQITVLENIRFYLGIRGIPLREEDLLRQAERLGLGAGELGCEPAGLSLGTRHKVSLLKALLLKSPFLLLDEAFAVLDAPTSENLERALKEEASSGKTVILTSQTSRGLEAFPDRFYLLKDGGMSGAEEAAHD